ncbi:transcriptional repressor [Pseudoroseicyclus sp. CXY001]|uniref:transcriptional repressor n=1 Tax=Pseudoroseicyclus sp. CXY001 TaxID=3242492 RepID=UPI003570FCE3
MTLGFETHDHRGCIREGVAQAEETCLSEGLQFTPHRRRVLEILLAEHRALGAYEILDQLREEGLAAQPPVAYRALDFLVKHGFAHRIERLNAFIACTHMDEAHTPAFLICRGCKSVAEATAELSRGRLGQVAGEAGFEIERVVVEAEGLCPACQASA